jgi:hypothetical protein
MLDPSFLLAEDPERPLAQKISQVETLADGSGFEVYVPEGLVRFLEEQLPQYDQDEESDQFMDFYVPNLERVDLSELRSRLYGSQRIRPFDPEVFPAYDDSDLTLAHDHRPFADRLNRSLREREGEDTEYRALRDSLFQEWVFLQEMSWIGSLTRASFRTMVHAGATSVEFGKRMARKAVRRTRNLGSDDPITKLDALMTTFKWVAAGSIAVTPTLLGVAGLETAIAGFVANRAFVLIDP